MSDSLSSPFGPLITLTGVDDCTSRADLQRLFDASPRVEVGILITADPDSRRRYPSPWAAIDMASFLGRRCSVHICGRRAKDLLLHNGDRYWLKHVGRIQINGAYTQVDLDCARRFGRPVITQESFAGDSGGLFADQILVDGSGGRGISPAEWTRPNEPLPVGFAGGLNSGNLATELSRIAKVSRDPWWVDMETGLRDERDWFNVDRALRCVEIFEKFLVTGASS